MIIPNFDILNETNLAYNKPLNLIKNCTIIVYYTSRQIEQKRAPHICTFEIVGMTLQLITVNCVDKYMKSMLSYILIFLQTNQNRRTETCNTIGTGSCWQISEVILFFRCQYLFIFGKYTINNWCWWNLNIQKNVFRLITFWCYRDIIMYSDRLWKQVQVF